MTAARGVRPNLVIVDEVQALADEVPAAAVVPGRERLLLVPEVAEVLREAPWAIRQRIRRKELDAIDIGRGSRTVYRVPESALDAFLAARSTKVRRSS